VGASLRLPLIHKDPFDRLMIATAPVQPCALLTCDQTIGQYPDVRIVW